jgi:undecaprenyl-diphosphatase
MSPIREWLERYELKALLAVLIVVAGIWFFFILAGEVLEGDTRELDNWTIHALRRADNPAQPLGPAWLPLVARDITALGSVTVLSLVVIAVVGFLILQRKYDAMRFVIASVVGSVLLSTVLKMLFARERPDVPHLVYVSSASFPSGHAMLSATVYLALGALLAAIEPKRSTRAYLLSVAMLLTFLVGLSRVYLGVHYPTDVLAGWTAGMVWAIVCWLMARGLRKRHMVEKL